MRAAMHMNLPSTAVGSLLLMASSAAGADTSFRLSPEAWARRCPAIEKFESLEARGIYMDVVKARGVYARHDTDPDGGTVVLDLRIDTSGKVRDLQLVSSTNGAFTAPVIRAVAEWRYKPVKLDGKEICVERRLEVLVGPANSKRESPSWGARGSYYRGNQRQPGSNN
jgi:TonB family protein